MNRLAAFVILGCFLLMSGCSTPDPTWRSKTAPLIEELAPDAIKLFPQEYRSLLETFEHGEAIYHVKEDDQEADIYYQLAFQKAERLRTEVRQMKQRLADEARQQAIEAARKLEEDRLMREAAEAELRLLEQQERLKQAETGKERTTHSKPSATEVKQLPASYTVRRGETLPQIAGRPEIYNDSSLWPIIYRSNRDQISDPKRLWPGQVLVVPRHFSRDDADGARRYSGRK